MKLTLKKCSNTRPDNSGYDDCATFFFGDVCPKCGAIKPISLCEIEIPKLYKIHGNLCQVITNLNTLTCENELVAEKKILKEAVETMEVAIC